jgi:hypothetical protein
LRPLEVKVSSKMAITPEQLFHEILQMENWESFQGYGPIPRIRIASFNPLTEQIVGSKIKVENLDGSTHVETIVVWDSYNFIQMELQEFSKPLSYLATHFIERWKLSGNSVTRSMELHSKSLLARPVLWIISFFMMQALKKHTVAICCANKPG